MAFADLADRHAGETAWIVGRGPSLSSLTPAHFGGGPLIVLNHAILNVRQLGLPNPLYSMQKDGCYPGELALADRLPCGGCPRDPMLAPIQPEILLLSVDESPHCFADYPARYLFDVMELGCAERSNMSTPVAVRIAQWMGVSELVMLGHDAYVSGDALAEDQESLDAYVQGAEQADVYAHSVGLPIRWA